MLTLIREGYELKLAASILLLSIFFGFEIHRVGLSKSSLNRLFFKRSRSSQLDLACAFIYALNLAPLIAWFLSFGLVQLIPRYIKTWFGQDLLYTIHDPWLRLIAYTLIYDFIWYWKHRLAHALPWWWEIHKVHHSATEFNIITSNRQHPFDEALKELFMCIPLSLAGAPPSTYLFIRIMRQMQQFLHHSNVSSQWGWIGRVVLVSPGDHHIHHSTNPDHFNKNFGNFVPWWDWIFGTRYLGQIPCIQIGLHADGRKLPSWWNELSTAYVNFFKTLFHPVHPDRGARQSSAAVRRS
jgi:sterol desaturase/sphingolipid hydroxylase (fatty acid hydroxylase superfamily)